MEGITVRHKSGTRIRDRTKSTSKKGTSSLEITYPNAAGIDLGAEKHWVAVPGDRCEEAVRSFGCLTPELHKLADWLEECGIDTVAMESTGIYWVPVYEVLEDRGFELFLVNTQQVKTVPGRKSDVLDCQWLQQLHSYGLLRGSFRPAVEIAELRAYLRQRETLVRGTTQQVLRMQKAGGLHDPVKQGGSM
jgi:transposase